MSKIVELDALGFLTGLLVVRRGYTDLMAEIAENGVSLGCTHISVSRVCL